MKNKILKILFISTLSISLIGCGKNNAAVPEDSTVEKTVVEENQEVPEENLDIDLTALNDSSIDIQVKTEEVVKDVEDEFIVEEVVTEEVEVSEIEEVSENTNNEIEIIGIDNSESDSLESNALEQTYWINEDWGMAFYFEDGISRNVGFGVESSDEYTCDESFITVNGTTNSYSVSGDTLTFSDETGFALVFKKGTKEEFESLITPTNFTTDSEYVGLTVNEFFDLGGIFKGYSAVGDNYTFSANINSINYNIKLEGDVSSALEDKTWEDNYEDFIGDFVISEVEILD